MGLCLYLFKIHWSTYVVSLIAGTTLNSFRGFVIQSRDAADGSLIGSFSDLPATAQLLFCDGQDSTVRS